MYVYVYVYVYVYGILQCVYVCERDTCFCSSILTRHVISRSRSAVLCAVAYIAVSDTGAGEVVVVVQLLLYTLSCAAFARIGQLPLGDHAEHDHAEVDEHPQLWVHNAFRAGANREERLARFHMTGRANAAREVGRLLQTPDFLHHEAQRVELQRQRDVNIFQARACSIVQTAILVGVAVTAMFHLID